MNEDRYLKIVNDMGVEEIYEILYVFSLNETKKEYIVYSDNEIQEDGSKKMYVSIFDSNSCEINPINSDDEWNIIEKAVQKLQENKGF